MKKTEMLKKNYEFKNVLSKGKYFSGKNIEAFIKMNNKKINFIGIAISSKIAKSVERNKIKRLIRENYRIIENYIKDGYDIVFMWKKSVKVDKANYEIINRDIKKILDKAKVLEEKI